MRYLSILALVLVTQVNAQTDPMAIDQPQDIVGLVAQQTDVLQSMSEKLARIETIVTDTNEKTADKNDVAQLFEKLESIKLNLNSGPTIVSTDPCAPVIANVDPCAPAVLGFGERIISIDGVPVNNSTEQVVQQITQQTPLQAPQVDINNLRVVASSGPFNKSITYTDETTGRQAFIEQGPFRQTITADPGMQVPSLGPVVRCIGGQCVQNAIGEYMPDRVTSPQNDLGRRPFSRFRLFRR